MGRFLQRREMRYGLQADRVAQLRHVVKKHNDATVIGLEKCFDRQAGKLRLPIANATLATIRADLLVVLIQYGVT